MPRPKPQHIWAIQSLFVSMQKQDQDCPSPDLGLALLSIKVLYRFVFIYKRVQSQENLSLITNKKMAYLKKIIKLLLMFLPSFSLEWYNTLILNTYPIINKNLEAPIMHATM